MLIVDKVNKKFGGVRAVKDVSFKIEEGSIVGLIGPNGSGKTTLFNLITGYYRIDSGKIIYDNIDLSTKKIHEIAMLGIRRTFQIVRPFSNLTVFENIFASAIQTANSKTEAKRQVVKIMDELKIREFENIKAKNLALPIKKKVGIAQAIVNNPKLILFDEVTAGLNPQETEQIIDLIKEINNKGATILTVEHKMKYIMKLSHNVIVLNNGTVIAHGEPGEIVKDPEVIKAYLGDDYKDVES